MMRDYMTTADMLAMHAVLVKRYGGASGVRDPGALEAAVFRPQSGYYSDVVQEACALMESLLINHPFTDDNKRAAFAACDVFLRINGYKLSADADWLFQRMMAWIEARDDRFERIVEDLRGIVTQH